MLLTHRTDVRTTTIAIAADSNGSISYGLTVCHTVNGETGEIVEEESDTIGRRIARLRLEQSPITLQGINLDTAIADAIRAGHIVTLRDLVKDAVLRDWKNAAARYDDDAFTQVINGLLDEEAKRVQAEEQAAWNDYKEDLSDEAWVTEMEEEGYADVNFLDYIDYSDRY